MLFWIVSIRIAYVVANFKFEKEFWKKGFDYVAGCDEVGRGCFAGPLVTGVVVFGKKTVVESGIIINDSKKVKPKQREKASKWIKKNALSWGIGEVSVSVINRVGIAKATQAAMRKAIVAANKRMDSARIDFLLVDAFYVPYMKGLRRKNQKAIVHGDEKSLSIAAASIIAKVYRDGLMLALSRNPKYKKYGWGRNKGYGTKEHQESIKKFGLTRYHRKQFVGTFLSKEN